MFFLNLFKKNIFKLSILSRLHKSKFVFNKDLTVGLNLYDDVSIFDQLYFYEMSQFLYNRYHIDFKNYIKYSFRILDIYFYKNFQSLSVYLKKTVINFRSRNIVFFSSEQCLALYIYFIKNSYLMKNLIKNNLNVNKIMRNSNLQNDFKFLSSNFTSNNHTPTLGGNGKLSCVIKNCNRSRSILVSKPSYNKMVKRTMMGPSGNNPKSPTSWPNSPTKPINTTTECSPTFSSTSLSPVNITHADDALPNYTPSQTPTPMVPKPYMPIQKEPSPSTPISEQIKSMSPGYYRGTMKSSNTTETCQDRNSTNENDYEVFEKPSLLNSPVIKTTPIKYKNNMIEKGDGQALSTHENQHVNLLDQREDGSRTITTIATSGKVNTVTKQKNIDAGTPNMSGDSAKPQRFTTLNEPRMLDPSIKEGEHFTVDGIHDAYYQQLPENIKAQIAATNIQAENNKVPILRLPNDSPQTSNDMGYKTEEEYDKNDFHESHD